MSGSFEYIPYECRRIMYAVAVLVHLVIKHFVRYFICKRIVYHKKMGGYILSLTMEACRYRFMHLLCHLCSSLSYSKRKLNLNHISWFYCFPKNVLVNFCKRYTISFDTFITEIPYIEHG